MDHPLGLLQELLLLNYKNYTLRYFIFWDLLIMSKAYLAHTRSLLLEVGRTPSAYDTQSFREPFKNETVQYSTF